MLIHAILPTEKDRVSLPCKSFDGISGISRCCLPAGFELACGFRFQAVPGASANPLCPFLSPQRGHSSYCSLSYTRIKISLRPPVFFLKRPWISQTTGLPEMGIASDDSLAAEEAE